MVVGWAVAVGIMTFGGSEFLAGITAIGILFRESSVSQSPAVPVLRALRRNLYVGGALGVLIGIVNLLANLDDPSAIGPSVAVALLSMVTAIVLAELFCRPAIERLTAVVAEPPDVSSEDATDNKEEGSVT